MSVAPMIAPELSEVRAHLDRLFCPVEDIYPQGLIELRYGPPEDLTHHRYFPVSEQGREAAAAFACGENRHGRNVYVGVNPRKGPEIPTRAGVSSDIEIAFWHFADIDRAEATDKLNERMKDAPPHLVVMTGTVPNNRPHLYWQLVEPEADLEAWKNRQRVIATALDGDMVIDPPRIMRLGGTVNYPTQAKLSRGYRVELTDVRQRWDKPRPPVDTQMLMSAFPVVPVADRGAKGADPRDFGEGKTARLMRAILAGQNWHNNCRNLVARLARQGRTDVEILAMAASFTLPGYTVADTVESFREYIRGARVKFGIAQPTDEDEHDDPQQQSSEGTFELLDMDQLEALPPPTWLIHELIADHGLSIIYGAPGGGKTFIALDMALRVAHGMDWHGVKTNQAGVIYIAGEGARGIGKRIKGWRREHALEGVEAPFLALPVPVQLLDADDRRKLLRTVDLAIQRMSFPVGLVIIDTVSRSLAGQDENGQEAMTLFVNACNAVQSFTGGAVLGIHHSGKDSSRGMRGSTVLLGGCDASIRLTKEEDGRVAIDVEKQKDAEQGEQVLMTLKKVGWEIDGDEITTLVPFKSDAPAALSRQLSIAEVRAIFEQIAIAWSENRPWSTAPQSKRSGRYLPSYMAGKYGLTEQAALDYAVKWQEEGILQTAICDEKHKVKGLEVLRSI